MEPTKLSGKTILIVDDEALLRSAIAFDFKRRGCRIIEAANGNEAYEKLHFQSVDVVVSDVRMPNGDGIELLKRITEMSGPRPVVILVTGFADLDENDAKRLGAQGLIAKPIDRKRMLKLVADSVEEKA